MTPRVGHQTFPDAKSRSAARELRTRRARSATTMASSFLCAAVEIVVDDDVVEERIVLDLGSRVREASLHRLFVVAGARAEATLELGHRRRKNEDRRPRREPWP